MYSRSLTRKLSFCGCCPFLHSQYQHLKESLVCVTKNGSLQYPRTCPEHGAVKKSYYARYLPSGCVWDKYKGVTTWRSKSTQGDPNVDRCWGKFADRYNADQCLCKVRVHTSWVTDSSVCRSVGGKVTSSYGVDNAEQSKQPPLCCPLNSKGQMECEGWETVKSCMEKGFAPCTITDLVAPSPSSSKDLVTKCSFSHGKCQCNEGELFLNLCFDYRKILITINLTYELIHGLFFLLFDKQDILLILIMKDVNMLLLM